MLETKAEIASGEVALTALRKRLADVIRPLGRVVVALSGGVDSAALLAAAVDALGTSDVIAVTGRSDAVTDEEIEDARRVAGTLGVLHEVLDTHEIERPGYKANNGDRCFHCRTELFELLARLAGERGFTTVVYGAILEDLGEHRPGMEAARRLGAVAPLLEAGAGKAEARALAAWAGLHVTDKPASACLASRIPDGFEVTPGRLSQIAQSERGLRALGLRQFRVRHHGDIARVELDEPGLARLADPEARATVIEAVKAAGFRYVVVDLEGYRPGGGRGGALYSILPARDIGQ